MTNDDQNIGNGDYDNGDFDNDDYNIDELTLDQLRSEYNERVVQLLNENPLSDDYDLSHFCAYAGRLASMGNAEYLKKAEVLFESDKYKGRIDEIFYNRLETVTWNISEQTGEYRGIQVETAQDYYCFFAHVGYEFNKKTKLALARMVEAAENIPLDEDGVAMIEDYLEFFPISEDDQLNVASAPMSEGSLAALDAVIMPDLGKEFPAVWDPQEGYWLISGRFGNVYVSRSRHNSNGSQFKVIDDDGRPGKVSRMRLGMLPLVQNEEKKSVWNVNYDWVSTKTGSELEAQPLTIRLSGGGTSTFYYDAQRARPGLRVSDVSARKSRLENALMAAATESGEQIEEFYWKNADGTIRLTGWLFSDRLEITWVGPQLSSIQLGQKPYSTENLEALTLTGEEIDATLDSARGEAFNVSVRVAGQDDYELLSYVER